MTKRIPTNLITGFLGVGKTTAILHLLAQKPSEEKWAVLVNEFGQVGIDGAILKQSGAEIREVPGGCICCVANLPLQVGLNTLIAHAKPDRLLIEPSGLGHPAAVVELLRNDYYGDLLELQAIFTLVDARKIGDEKYREHATFRDQLSIADCIVANKDELATASDRERLQEYLAEFEPLTYVYAAVEQGAINPEWLSLPHRLPRAQKLPASGEHNLSAGMLNRLAPPLSVPSETQLCVRREGRGLGYFSCGWIFSAAAVFNMNQLFTVLHGLDVGRLKGLVNTDQGAFIVNMENGVLSINNGGAAIDSRIEIINENNLDWPSLESLLLTAITTD